MVFPGEHDGAADSGSHVIVLACGRVRVAEEWAGKDLYRTATRGKKRKGRIEKLIQHVILGKLCISVTRRCFLSQFRAAHELESPAKVKRSNNSASRQVTASN